MCKWGELYLKSYLQKIKRKKYVSQWKRRKHQEKLINLYNDRIGRGWCFPTNWWLHLFTMYKNTWKQGTWGKLLTDLWTWLEVDSIIIYGGQRTPKFTITGLQKRNRISFCLHRAEKSCSFFSPNARHLILLKAISPINMIESECSSQPKKLIWGLLVR